MIARALALLVASATSAAAEAPAPRAKPTSNVVVVSNYDGDNFTVLRRDGGGLRIRLLGVDAPELGWRAECDLEQAKADQARTALAEVLADGNVIVHGRYFDRFGRLIATVTVDGRDLAATLLAAGHVRPWRGRKVDWCGDE